MSASNSNLTQMGYDLVVGITQDAINASLKRFIDHTAFQFQPVYYQYIDDSATEVKAISLEDLKAQTVTENWPEGVDPFSSLLADGTNNKSDQSVAKEGIQALYDAYFAFAYLAVVGIPRNAPDIVTLYDYHNPNAQSVRYNMYFETFTVVDLILGTHGAWTYTRIDQPKDAPWVYQWKVDLHISSSNEDFNQLPKATQDAIRNLNTGTAFSIQQLALDLTNAPQYDGAVSDEGAYIPNERLYTQYLNQFWDYLKDTEAVVFLNAVQPTSVTSSTPSIVPTDMNFVVTPYDKTGDHAGLDTLNYLMMTNNRAFPSSITPLGWSWVDASVPATNRPDGVMSINRKDFSTYLNDLFSPLLEQICLNPAIDLKGDGIKVKVSYSQSFNKDNRYTYQNEGSDPTHALTFYYKSPVSKDDILLGSWSTKIWASVNSDVYLEGNTIRCVTLGLAYMDFEVSYGISKTKGYLVAQENTTVFTLSTTTKGVLQVTAKTDSEDLTQSKDKNKPYYDGDLDPSIWAQFVTGGGMDNVIDKMNKQVSRLTSWMNDFDDDLLKALNGVTAWTFPGVETFSFSDCEFSNHQDLMVDVKYTTTN